MAIIAGKVPPPAELPPGYQARVVVRFTRESKLPATRQASAALSGPSSRAWQALENSLPGIALVPYFFAGDNAPLRLLARKAPPADKLARFQAYFAVECPRGADLVQVARALSGWPEVEAAYVEGGPTQPPVNAGDDPRSANQGFLNAAPQGIDAHWAWPESDGHGIGFVDLEQGWTLDHEDLAAAGISIISGVSQAYHGHGTAVLGEVCSVDNRLGGVGIAPRAGTRVVSQWRTTMTYNTAEAILSAAAVMNAGDVLLLEAQTRYPTATGYVPVEVEDAVFDAIEHATTDLGIVVVEAAGNGSVDLDAFATMAGRHILDRSSVDFRDSGAIMVGAASAGVPHRRLSFSNFGSRIDCFGWGEGIDTTGDGWGSTSTNDYTTGFGGTSGASPIVAGAALLVQGSRVRAGLARHAPLALRAELSSPSLNTASADPAADRIGVMPDLRALIQSTTVRALQDADRWRLVALILFGVIHDGGGFIFKPGSGPIPIDPWGPMTALAEEKREMLLGMAVTELAGLLTDSTSRRALNAAGVGVMKRSLEKLAQRG